MLKPKGVIFSVILLCLLIIDISATAQNKSSDIFSPDNRLFDCFENSYIEMLQEKNPSLIMYYNFFLDSSYYVVDLPAEKQEFVNKLESLDLGNDQDIKCVNVLKYDIKLDFEKITYFRLGNTQKMIVFYSGKELFEKYNDYRRSYGLIDESQEK
ncbi:MAG: hypothetical protein HOB05_02760 [Bacteroidetes bacterium]|jgi:hypothetical protein|nr:hypothetical protein [Bacteroidota bacterium]